MGADVAETTEGEEVHVHKMVKAVAENNKLDISEIVTTKQKLCTIAPLFVQLCKADGSVTGDIIPKDKITSITEAGVITATAQETEGDGGIKDGATYLVDCYVTRTTSDVTEVQVRKDKFAGYFYVEAETLYRRQDTGADLPAVITIPKVKIQSNFSFSMSADGDPSTFSFVMDAFPDKWCCQAA